MPKSFQHVPHPHIERRTAQEIQKHMEAQDLEIEKIMSAISRLRLT